MHHAIQDALRLHFNTVQVFVKNQRQWKAAPFKPDDLLEWRKLRQTPEFGPIVAHATYLINLAAGDDAAFAKSVAAFGEELDRCEELQIPYLVVHPGAAGEQPVETALARVVVALNELLAARPSHKVMPLLETTAGQGSAIGRRFEELGAIIRHVREPQRVGVCVDTCHVFAAGYDIRDKKQYAAMMALAEREIGPQRIRCWHLNDSKGDCGSRLDRHEHIGLGRIGDAGFRNVLSDERFFGVPMILETPKDEDDRGREWDAVNLARLRKLAK